MYITLGGNEAGVAYFRLACLYPGSLVGFTVTCDAARIFKVLSELGSPLILRMNS